MKAGELVEAGEPDNSRQPAQTATVPFELPAATNHVEGISERGLSSPVESPMASPGVFSPGKLASNSVLSASSPKIRPASPKAGDNPSPKASPLQPVVDDDSSDDEPPIMISPGRLRPLPRTTRLEVLTVPPDSIRLKLSLDSGCTDNHRVCMCVCRFCVFVTIVALVLVACRVSRCSRVTPRFPPGTSPSRR